MSLLEGFSDYVMDEVGRDLVPDVERISARFHERRTKRTPFERAMLRLTGLDLKMEQYRRARRSSGPSPRNADRRRLTRLWDGPETLPRDGEIEEPERWMTRVLDGVGDVTDVGAVPDRSSPQPDPDPAAAQAAPRRPSR